MATKQIGITAPVPAGEWNATTTYNQLNIVTLNYSTYIAKQASVGVQPGVTTGWGDYWMVIVDYIALKNAHALSFYIPQVVPGRTMTKLTTGTAQSAVGGYSAPQGYTFFDYVESDGTQYINTGVIPNTNTGFYVDFNTSSSVSTANYGCIFGQRTGTGQEEYQLSTFSQNDYAGIFRRIGTTYNPGIVQSVRQQISFINGLLTRSDNRPSGLDKTQTIPTPALQGEYPISIFALNTAGYVEQSSATKLYRLKLYSGSTIVRDFVPASDANGNVGLFDISILSEYQG